MEKPDLQPDAAPPAGTVTTVRWLRHGQPVPDGWRLADQRLDTHHNAFGVLIVEDPPCPTTEKPMHQPPTAARPDHLRRLVDALLDSATRAEADKVDSAEIVAFLTRGLTQAAAADDTMKTAATLAPLPPGERARMAQAAATTPTDAEIEALMGDDEDAAPSPLQEVKATMERNRRRRLPL